MGLFTKSKESLTVKLDEAKIPDEIVKLEEGLKAKVAGQDRAIKHFVRVHETYMAGMAATDRPLGVFLFVGPTGSGKTHATEVFAELMGVTLIKMDCAEYQASHEISKLIGSPPGYVGHKDTEAKISKKAIEAKWADGKSPKYTIILFDEIEKAHNSMHQILLGIMDRATLTLGSNETVDMHNCVIVLTSNLGSSDMKKILSDTKEMGFVAKKENQQSTEDDIYHAAKDAVKKFFSMEFFNRVDRMIVFHPLTDENLRRILDIELKRIQDRILKSHKYISVDLSDRAKDFIIKEGTSREFGARELRRTLERFLVSKLTRAFATKQAVDGDMIVADKVLEHDGLTLDIVKDVMVIPEKPVAIPEATSNTSGPHPVIKPKAAWVNPDLPSHWAPAESNVNPGYCARCGFRWYAGHKCLLDPSPSGFDCSKKDLAPFEQFKKDLEEKAKKWGGK